MARLLSQVCGPVATGFWSLPGVRETRTCAAMEEITRCARIAL